MNLLSEKKELKTHRKSQLIEIFLSRFLLNKSVGFSFFLNIFAEPFIRSFEFTSTLSSLVSFAFESS